MRRIAVLCCLLPLLGGCTASFILGEVPPQLPRCPSQTAQPAEEVSPAVLLMAQSVPSASWLPCINALPVGFTFERLEATDRGAHFWLDTGGEHTHAIRVAVARDCDLRGAQETPSAQDGIRRYERIDEASADYRGEHYFDYAGGCITYDFTLRGTTGAASAAALSRSLGFVSRATIARLLHDYSDGRLDLDPTSAGGAG